MANYIIDGQVTDCSVVDNGSDGKRAIRCSGTINILIPICQPVLSWSLTLPFSPTDHSFTITFKTPLKYTGQDPSLTTYKNTAFFEDGLGIYTSEAQVSPNKQTQQTVVKAEAIMRLPNKSRGASIPIMQKQACKMPASMIQSPTIRYLSPALHVSISIRFPGWRIYAAKRTNARGIWLFYDIGTGQSVRYWQNVNRTPAWCSAGRSEGRPCCIERASPPLFLVQFDTTVEGTVVKKNIRTEADFYNDFTPKETLTSKVAVNNGGLLLYKNGYQGADGYAYWNVTINPSQSTLTDTKVVDVPSSNQSILMSSLTINGMQVDQSGKLTPDLALHSYRVRIMTPLTPMSTAHGHWPLPWKGNMQQSTAHTIWATRRLFMSILKRQRNAANHEHCYDHR